MKITSKVQNDFESIYGKLEELNEDVLANKKVWIRFFTNEEEYNTIKDMFIPVPLLVYNETLLYIVVDRIRN